MKNLYKCPHCQAVLNPSVKVLLTIGYKKKKGMILLSPQPGNFKSIYDDSIKEIIKPGTTVTFSCPVCAADLTAPANKKFAELTMVKTTGDRCRIEISRVFGQQATYIIDGDDVTGYGEDVSEGGQTNFFGA